MHRLICQLLEFLHWAEGAWRCLEWIGRTADAELLWLLFKVGGIAFNQTYDFVSIGLNYDFAHWCLMHRILFRKSWLWAILWDVLLHLCVSFAEDCFQAGTVYITVSKEIFATLAKDVLEAVVTSIWSTALEWFGIMMRCLRECSTTSEWLLMTVVVSFADWSSSWLDDCVKHRLDWGAGRLWVVLGTSVGLSCRLRCPF